MSGCSRVARIFDPACLVVLVIPTIALLLGCGESLTGPGVSLPAPSQLRITHMSFERVTLTWLDNSLDEDGFIIWQSLYKQGGYQEVARVDRDVTSLIISDLADTSEYYFRASAFNSSGSSRRSNAAHKTVYRSVVGDTLGDYQAVDQFGNVARISDFKGKVICIYFSELEHG